MSCAVRVTPRAKIERAKKIITRPARPPLNETFLISNPPDIQTVALLPQNTASNTMLMQVAVAAAATAADAPACRRSRRSGSSIPCFDYFVHRSGTIDASTIRGKSPGMIQTIANRAWAGLSLQKQQDVVEQAREEELCCPSQTSPDPAQDVPDRRNSSSNNADASPEPTVEDNAGIAARPGDDNVEAGGASPSPWWWMEEAATVKRIWQSCQCRCFCCRHRQFWWIDRGEFGCAAG